MRDIPSVRANRVGRVDKPLMAYVQRVAGKSSLAKITRSTSFDLEATSASAR